MAVHALAQQLLGLAAMPARFQQHGLGRRLDVGLEGLAAPMVGPGRSSANSALGSASRRRSRSLRSGCPTAAALLRHAICGGAAVVVRRSVRKDEHGDGQRARIGAAIQFTSARQ